MRAACVHAQRGAARKAADARVRARARAPHAACARTRVTRMCTSAVCVPTHICATCARTSTAHARARNRNACMHARTQHTTMTKAYSHARTQQCSPTFTVLPQVGVLLLSALALCTVATSLAPICSLWVAALASAGSWQYRSASLPCMYQASTHPMNGTPPALASGCEFYCVSERLRDPRMPLAGRVCAPRDQLANSQTCPTSSWNTCLQV